MAITFYEIFNGDGGNFETDAAPWGLVGIDSFNDISRVSLPVGEGSYSAKISFNSGVAASPALLPNTSGGRFLRILSTSDDGGNLRGDLNEGFDKLNFFRIRIGVSAPNVTDLSKFKIGMNTDEQAGSDGLVEPNLKSYSVGSNIVLTDPVPQSIKRLDQIGLGTFGTVIIHNLFAYAFASSGKRSYATLKIYHEESITSQDFKDQLDGMNIYIDVARQTKYFTPVKVSGNVTNATNSAGDNGAIDLTLTDGLAGATYSFEWNDGVTTQNRTGLSAGNYTVKVITDGVEGLSTTKSFQVEAIELGNLNVTGEVSNITTGGGSDGEIDLTVTGGSGNYEFAWSDGVTTQSRTGLSEGVYEVLVTDVETGQEGSAIFQLQDPANVEPEIGFFDVPKMQSIHFSRMRTKSQIEDGNYFDLSSHSQQKDRFSSFGYGFCYSQKFRQSDKIPVQIRSQEPTINIDVFDEDDVKVKTVIPSKKTNYLNIEQEYQIRIENHGAGKSRVYFTGFNVIPIQLEPNESTIEIINSSEPDINGSYLVLSVEVDSIINSEYILINKNYSYATNSETGTGLLLFSQVNFDIYEGILDFSTLDEGNYYVKTYLQGFENETAHYSEPILIKFAFKDNIKLDYSNFDNAYNIDYTTGIVNTIRPDCVMFKRLPAVENTVIRNTNNSLEMLRSKPRRKFEVTFVMLPPYLLEKLAMALSHDVLNINGVQFICEEGLSEPEYIDRFGLATAVAVVEQVGWFDNFNSDDIGGIETDQSLIIGNDGFIKR